MCRTMENQCTTLPYSESPVQQNSIIELHGVNLGYRRKKIASELSLQFYPNEIVSLLGANGCGKTTLLKSIMGIIPLLGGEIFIAGKTQSQWSRKALAKIMGYVPQAQNNYFPFTTEAVILMGRTASLHWAGTPKADDMEAVTRVMKQLEIEYLAGKLYPQLSGGEKQLILIARALVQAPKILIMDEPTSSLDYGNQLRVLEQISRLKQEGMTILMTTHQPEHAVRVADRLLLFHQGEMIADGSSEQVLTASNLATIYRLPEEMIRENLQGILL